MLKTLIALAVVALPWAGAAEPPARPNFVVIMADDLGWGELGCYGQRKIRTPRLDRMAADGMRFTHAYSPAPVCAPTRASLLTGLHTGHAPIRDNKEVQPEGQASLPAGTPSLPRLFKDAGYATGVFGKWALGAPGSEGEPNRHGVDSFFGYLCQRQAHNFYPTHLWRNAEKVELGGNTRGNLVGRHYSHDLIFDEALRFVREHRDRSFVLYLPVTIPHVALQVPDDSLNEYLGAFPEEPYDGKSGYLPHPTPHAAYAAMVTRLDRDVGRLLDLLGELGLDERTLVIFTSDNGPTHGRVGGADSAFFESTAGLRGLKGSLFEGGIRVPFIARWPGTIAPGGTSDLPIALYDILPTLAQLASIPPPPEIDGLSIAPTLTGRGDQAPRDFLFWEFPGYGGQQALRVGSLKAIRVNLHKDPAAPVEVYDLAADPAESRNLAAERPDFVARALRIWRERRTLSPAFPFPALDAPPP